MSELLTINVSDHTEKKNGLTYLSWAWAWAEVLKIDQHATWEAVEFNGIPAAILPDTSAMVKVIVTIKGHAKSCWLPVMNHKNQAIKGPDAFAINTAIVRCLTKCIGMHGLGLYIYAGEDLPEQAQAPEPEPVISAQRYSELDEFALYLIDCHENEKDMDAIRAWYDAGSWAADQEVKAEEMKYTWGLLQKQSKLRSAIKANHPDRLNKAAE